jgi:hypothetical protein
VVVVAAALATGPLPLAHATDSRVRTVTRKHGESRSGRLLVHHLEVAGPALRLRQRDGYRQAVVVRVPATGRVQVTPYNVEANLSVILPDGRRHRHRHAPADPADSTPMSRSTGLLRL